MYLCRLSAQEAFPCLPSRSSFEVRTVRPATERPVQSLNLDRELPQPLSATLLLRTPAFFALLAVAHLRPPPHRHR